MTASFCGMQMTKLFRFVFIIRYYYLQVCYLYIALIYLFFYNGDNLLKGNANRCPRGTG